MWITLQIMGSSGIGRMIEHGYEMAMFAELEIHKYPGWEIVSAAQQGIVNFRYAPAGFPSHRLDWMNQAIAREITGGGYAQILTTELNGKKVLRMCTLNPQTTEEDICKTVGLLAQSRVITGKWYQLSEKVS